MTLGYDPAKKRFVGSFVASMMTFLWLYDGELDAAQKVLKLDAEGPSFAGEGKMAKYVDATGPRHFLARNPAHPAGKRNSP
jgi:hypothetical protein